MINQFMRRALCALLILSFALTSCAQSPICFQPCVEEPQLCLQGAPSCFPEFSAEEANTDWGKEMRIGLAFAREYDLYRAITSFKRAFVLIPKNELERRRQISYELVVCYYLGGKYREAIDTFEESPLTSVKGDFPAFRSLLILLESAYSALGENERARQVMQIISPSDKETAYRIELSHALREGEEDIVLDLTEETCLHESIAEPIQRYQSKKKSPSHAKNLQAILPGAGYLYVGQKKTALTSLIVNSLFIWAAYSFFDKGNIGAGLFTLSLETGWYFGGINGAGLAANEYNEILYEDLAQKILQREKLYPVMMLECVF